MTIHAVLTVKFRAFGIDFATVSRDVDVTDRLTILASLPNLGINPWKKVLINDKGVYLALEKR